MPEPKGRMIEFSAGPGKGQGYLSAPDKPRGGVLVLHAWWGLNDFFRSVSDKLAHEGYAAFAPDLRQGRVAKTVDEAKAMLGTANEEETFPPIVLGGLDQLKSQPGLKGQGLGVVGFSMGAAWALWLSTKRPEEIKSVVTFYGTYPIDFSKSQASYLGHYSPEDEWEPIAEVRKLEDKIREANRPVHFHIYPGTKHWFFERDRPEYDAPAATLAWHRTVEFLRDRLGEK